MPPLSFSPPGSSSYSKASAALLALAVLLSTLMLGALHTPVLCGICALVAVAAFIGWFPGSPLRARLPATILLVTGVALTAFTALQALSLPAAVVRVLSPAAAEVWAGALAPLHEPGPAWTSLSLDPTATRIQVLRGVTYVLTFLIALRIAERRRGTRFLSIVIVGTALVLAMAALIHPILGAERVWGVYKPIEQIAGRHIAPLLNPNHLAAYINIGFCLALGMSVDRRADRYRPIAVAVAVLLASTQLWVASRGGAVAMVFGAVCVLLMARVSRRFATRTSSSVILPAIVIAAGLAMIVLGASQEASTELNSTDVSKLRSALSALPLAARYPLFGVGRGAFEVAFPAIRHDQAGYVDFTHPENLPVQWLTEWGIPAGVLGLLALGTALRPRVLVVSASPAVGAWAAIATTAVHNLVDFNSEVPAVGIAIATCAAMIVAGRGTGRSGWVHQWGAYPRAVAWTMGLAGLGSIAVALAGWPHELIEERRELYAAISHGDGSEDFSGAERDALLRHPSEPYVPFIAAVDAMHRGRSVVPWVDRSLTLSPIYGPAHFVLAEQLERDWPAQARLEYRLAMTQQSTMVYQVLPRATRLVQTFDEAFELVPMTASRMSILEALALSLRERLPSTRARLDEIISKADANAVGPLDRIVEEVTADLQAGEAAPWCEEHAECVQPGLAAVRRLSAIRPGQCGPFVARARLELASEGTTVALHELQANALTAVDPTVCWVALGELALASKSDGYVTVAEEAMARSGCGSDEECADHLAWAASLEERQGNASRAMSYYARAIEKAPERRDLVERMAHLASSLGLHAEALEAYRKLARMSPDAERWNQAADREKTQLFKEAMPGPRAP